MSARNEVENHEASLRKHLPETPENYKLVSLGDASIGFHRFVGGEELPGHLERDDVVFLPLIFPERWILFGSRTWRDGRQGPMLDFGRAKFWIEGGEPKLSKERSRYSNSMIEVASDYDLYLNYGGRITPLENRSLVAIEIDVEILRPEYLDYLFSRTVGRYMIDVVSETIPAPFGWDRAFMAPHPFDEEKWLQEWNTVISISDEKLPEMPMLIPSPQAQDAVLKLKREIYRIENKITEFEQTLETYRKILHDMPDIETARSIIEEISPIKTDEVWRLEESETLEFKSSIWATYHREKGDLIEGAKKNLKTEDSIIKTIAAFMNTGGGTLYIGIQDRPEKRVVGIESDFQYSGGTRDVESFQNSLNNVLKEAFSDPSILTQLETKIEHIEGKAVCKLTADTINGNWAWVNVKTMDKGGPMEEVFFVRNGPSTNRMSNSSGHEYRKNKEKLWGLRE